MLYSMSQTVEVIVYGVAGTGNQQARFNFPDQPYLDGKQILGIETFTVNDMAVSPNNNALIDVATLKKAYLNLYTSNPDMPGEGQNLNFQNVPLSCLHTLENATNDPFERQPFLLKGQIISWDKCFIVLPSAIGNTSNVSFFFNVSFRSNVKNPV